MSTSWRTSSWIGAAIGVVAAFVLTWLVREGWQVLLSAVQEGVATIAGPGWLLVALGVVLVAVVVGADFHPLISAVPAAWFLLLFGPSLAGMQMGTPRWYPDWMTSYLLQAISPAAFIVTGVLVAGTIAAYVRRLFASKPAVVEPEEAHP